LLLSRLFINFQCAFIRYFFNPALFKKNLLRGNPFIKTEVSLITYFATNILYYLKELLTIINGCVNNEAKSQKILYEKYLGYALKIAFRYVGSYENAANAANDAFIKIFKGFKKFEIRDPENIEAMLLGWMRKIVINVSIDYMRKESLMAKHAFISDSMWLQPDASNRGDNQLMYKELISLIRKLSPAYRVVFNLHVIDGYSHQEIAAMLGISPGTSKSNLAKARAFLQKFLIKDTKGNVLCFT
jgi:RNA polymerase sigma factor (sigma-70 family)